MVVKMSSSYSSTSRRQGKAVSDNKQTTLPSDRHPALLSQYSHHHNWVLIRAFRREQGLMINPRLLNFTREPQDFFDAQFRWTLRQPGAGAQRFLLEVLGQHGLNASVLNSEQVALSEREAAASIVMDQADVRATQGPF